MEPRIFSKDEALRIFAIYGAACKREGGSAAKRTAEMREGFVSAMLEYALLRGMLDKGLVHVTPSGTTYEARWDGEGLVLTEERTASKAPR